MLKMNVEDVLHPHQSVVGMALVPALVHCKLDETSSLCMLRKVGLSKEQIFDTGFQNSSCFSE